MHPDSVPRHELLTQVSEGAVRTYHALARTGAVVMVHFLDRTPVDQAARARSLIERLEPAERRKVLEIIDGDASIAVVTKFILDFDSFFAWLEKGVGSDTEANRSPVMGPDVPAPSTLSKSEPSTSPAAPAGGASETPGEFTREFLAFELGANRLQDESQLRADEPPPFESAHPQPTASPAEPRSGRLSPEGDTGAFPSNDQPGEFTRMFGAVESSDADSAAPFSPDPAGSPEGHAPAHPPMEPLSNAPGEFTRMFGAVQPGDADSAPPSSSDYSGSPEGHAAAPPPLESQTNEPGEFTRMFGAVKPPDGALSGELRGLSSPAHSDLPQQRRSDSTDASRAVPPGETGSPRLRWRESTALPSAPSEPKRPGEFTRIFGRQDAPDPSGGGAERGSGLNYGGHAGGSKSGGGIDDGYLDRLAGGGPDPIPATHEPQVSRENPSPVADGQAIPPWLGADPGGTRPPATSGPSEYTRIISAQRPPAPDPAPPASGAQPSSGPPAIPGIPAIQGTPALPGVPAAPGIPKPPTVPHFNPPAIPQPGVPPPAPGNPPAGGAGKPTLLLAAILLVMVAILAVLVFFALRTPSGSQTPEDVPVTEGVQASRVGS